MRALFFGLAAAALAAACSSSNDGGAPADAGRDVGEDGSAPPEDATAADVNTNPNCPASIDAFCGMPAAVCPMTWSEATNQCPGAIFGLSSAPCGGYDVATLAQPPGSGAIDYYYDTASGKLVAIVVFPTPPSRDRPCIMGPASFSIPVPCSISSCYDAGAATDAGHD